MDFLAERRQSFDNFSFRVLFYFFFSFKENYFDGLCYRVGLIYIETMCELYSEFSVYFVKNSEFN